MVDAGPGEGAAHVPEQLALDELRRQRRAVHGDEGAPRPQAVVVDRPGDELLARPALPADEDGGRVAARGPDLPEHGVHERASAQDVPEPEPLLEQGARAVELLLQAGRPPAELPLQRDLRGDVADHPDHVLHSSLAVEERGVGDLQPARPAAGGRQADAAVPLPALEREDAVGGAGLGLRHPAAEQSVAGAGALEKALPGATGQELAGLVADEDAVIAVDDEDADGGAVEDGEEVGWGRRGHLAIPRALLSGF
jgi:hypothetical protein